MTALMTGGAASGGNSDAITIQLKENPSKDEAPSVAGFFLPISAIGKHLAASLQVCVTFMPGQSVFFIGPLYFIRLNHPAVTDFEGFVCGLVTESKIEKIWTLE